MTLDIASYHETMTRHLTFFLFTLLFWTFSQGQKIGEYYISIPSDTLQNCRLRFLSDTTVELSTVPRHMSRQLSIIFKYSMYDTTINILTKDINSNDRFSLTSYGYVYFIKSNIMLIKIDNGFIDIKNSLIYFQQSNSNGSCKLYYIIDRKTYVQDMGVTDGYGLIKKEPKKNKKLENKLNKIKVDIDKYHLEFLKGLEAYQKNGAKYVGGVIIITKK